MAKGLRMPIARSTHTRADKKLQRVFVDVSGKMAVPSIGGKWYTLIVRDDSTRFTRVYFLGKKSDAASAFELFLAEVRADGTPPAVMAVTSDNGGEFSGGDFGKLRRKRGIKQEFMPADSPKYNGVAERALSLINDTSLAARIQAPVLYPGASAYPSLWTEAMSWACHVLNRIATPANSGDKSPYEMWYGSPPSPGEVWPFLKPAYCRVKRDDKSQPKAQDRYYVGPSVDHPRDCMRVLTAPRSILTTRNVTWQHVPSAPPAPPQQLPPFVEEGEPTAGECASGEGASSQGGGRMEDLYSESDIDMTEVWPPVPPATREAPAAEPGARVEGGAEGNPPTPSVSPRRTDFGGINGSSSSRSSDDSRTSSGSSNSNDSGDLPAFVGRPVRDLEVFGELPTLQRGRTKSQSRDLTISTSYADALLAYAMRTAEMERAHRSLLEERLEKEHERLAELERRAALLEQREEEQDSDCPPRNGGRTTTRASKYSVTNREETQRS